jgi:hypothetical protein
VLGRELGFARFVNSVGLVFGSRITHQDEQSDYI